LGDPAPAPLPGADADAEDLRNSYARRLLRRPLVAIGSILLVAATFVWVGLGAGAVYGAIAGLMMLAIVLFIVNRIASRRAEREFFTAYAAARDLILVESADRVPAATPLLRQGDSRFARDVLTGRLPGGVAGTLALYTYVEEHGEQSTDHRFTVAICDLPQLAPFVDRLYCERRHGFRFLDSAEDALRTRNQRIELESEEVDRRYEVFAGSHEDPVRVRRVFEPTFLVWLAEQAPEDFAFELEAGTLCCNVGGQRKTSNALDELCAATAMVASRLTDEAGARQG
jgi:hypothetical protein